MLVSFTCHFSLIYGFCLPNKSSGLSESRHKSSIDLPVTSLLVFTWKHAIYHRRSGTWPGMGILSMRNDDMLQIKQHTHRYPNAEQSHQTIMACNARYLDTRGFALFILIFYIQSNISSHVRKIAAYERVRCDCSHYMRRNVENGTPSRTSIDHRCTSALSKSLPWPIVNKMKITCLQWQKWVVLWFVNSADRICSNISIIVFS